MTRKWPSLGRSESFLAMASQTLRCCDFLCFGFAVWGRDRPDELNAAKHNRRGQSACVHHFIEGEAKLVTQSKPHSTNPRGQALERNVSSRYIQPVV
ncbi:MAG: hypothetical protein OSA51_07135 [Octadecabacter sp.]|nr:hypothetical protein [Octadecabacter sp.]